MTTEMRPGESARGQAKAIEASIWDTRDCGRLLFASAAIAQLGERQTEDLKVPGSIPGLGTFLAPASILCEGRCDNSQQWFKIKIKCNFLAS